MPRSFRRIALDLPLIALAAAVCGGLGASDFCFHAGGVEELGLRHCDIPVSSETKVVYLVNPTLNRPGEAGDLLRAQAASRPPSGELKPVAFDGSEIAKLSGPGRPGDTAMYDAVSDVAEHFFKYMFSQVPSTERSLQRAIQEENRTDFPLMTFDAVPALFSSGGNDRMMQTLVTVRLFMVHVEEDRERDLRWVTRCELCFEDSAIGWAELPAGGDAVAAVSASILDALRGKIARSFVHAPALRRPSKGIDQPRRELIDRSISEALEAAATGEGRPPAESAGVSKEEKR